MDGKGKEQRKSSSYPSSSDGISTEETPATRSPDIHSMIEELTKKLAEGFKQTNKELKEIKQTLDELKEKNKSEPNHMQPPRFSLKFKSKVENSVVKGESIKTDQGDLIVVDLYDDGNLIEPSHPLASAKVRIVVLRGEKFDISRCNWSEEYFEASKELTVDNCIFRLNGGTGRHSGTTILKNSRNMKVKLGVMVVPDDSYGTYKDERVLEGVSQESFQVRDPPRPSKKQKQAPVGCGQEQNGPMPNTKYSSRPTSNTQTMGNISGLLPLQADTNMPSSSSTPRDNTLGADPQHSVEPWTNQRPSSFSERHRDISAGVQMPMISDSMNQTMHSRGVGDLANQPLHSLNGQALVGCGQERNDTMPYSSSPSLIQTAENSQLQFQEYINMHSSLRTPRDNTFGADLMMQIQQPHSFPEDHRISAGGVQTLMTGDFMNQTMHNPGGGVQTWAISNPMDHHTSAGVQTSVISDSINQNMLDAVVGQPIPNPIGVPDPNGVLRRPAALSYRPDVETTKRWNFLDQFMLLYSSQRKIHSGDFPTMRLMPEHYDSLTTYSQGPYQRLFFSEEALFLKKMMRDLPITTIPKEVMQTRRNRGVLIQPLEPDDSDDESPLKRKLRNKYQLRFVNKVCEAYYTGEKIKADDGNLLNVALYDENNAKITSGPLSSASVEVVVLHGDFNAAGEDYWTSEEFSSCVVCPQSRNERPAVGGDRVLVLVDGQASLGYAFFQKSSIYARTGKFKMGVMLASAPDERVREGISEPFWVWIRKGGRTGFTFFQRWHRAINAIIFIWRLQSMRRPVLSRSEPNDMQPPRFSLKIRSRMKDAVEKGKSIITDDGDSIVVDLYDGDNLIARSHPLASAWVMMVVLDGKFNTRRCSWSREDFEKSIKRPREGNSAIGDVNQRIESIVSNCIFNLEGGTRRHSGATIWENSGNRKVKLGVMVLPDDSYGEYTNERVLEGVSEESFLVRDPHRTRKKQKKAVEHSQSPLAEQEWIIGTPYHKMLIKRDIRDVQNEEYLPFADVKENDNEDAAEEAHDGNSGKEKVIKMEVSGHRNERALPKYLAFKGDNDMYLSARVIEGYNYLQFSSSDIGDSTVMHTTFTNGDGTVRIKSNQFGKFWRRSPNWIWADSNDTTCNNSDTLFKVIRIDNNYIALQNLGNHNFCKRLTTEGKTSCLNAAVQTISAEAKLKLEETVLSRQIYDVNFNLSKARIYDIKVLTMTTASSINNSSSTNTAKLTMKYTETETRTWDSRATMKLAVETKIQTGVPFIADGTIQIKAEFSGSYGWGSYIQKTTEQEINYEVTVPPKSKVTVSVLATQGTCEVPFTYKQDDLLYTGEEVTYDLKDGLYTGINCYSLKYDIKEEKIE